MRDYEMTLLRVSAILQVMTASQPTSDEIVAALRASGWLLEQEAADRLAEAGYYTKLGYAYQDADDPNIGVPALRGQVSR